MWMRIELPVNTRICFCDNDATGPSAPCFFGWKRHVKLRRSNWEIEATGGPLMEYLRTQNDSKIPVCDNTNWSIRGTILKRLKKMQSHLIKTFIYHVPPTISRLSRFNWGKCTYPLCECLSTKDRDHSIMRCHHPSTWVSWRTVCLTQVL